MLICAFLFLSCILCSRENRTHKPDESSVDEPFVDFYTHLPEHKYDEKDESGWHKLVFTPVSQTMCLSFYQPFLFVLEVIEVTKTNQNLIIHNENKACDAFYDPHLSLNDEIDEEQKNRAAASIDSVDNVDIRKGPVVVELKYAKPKPTFLFMPGGKYILCFTPFYKQVYDFQLKAYETLTQHAIIKVRIVPNQQQQ